MIVPEYAPGQWHAVVGGGIVALLAPTTSPETVRAVWDAAPAAGGLTDQLEVLLRGGISGLQPFALVDVTGGRVHAALRGDVEVEVSGAGGSRVLAAGEVTTWSERVAEGADVMTVRVAGSAPWTVSTALPLAAGVVLAGGVRVALSATAGAGVEQIRADDDAERVGGAAVSSHAEPVDEPEPAEQPEPVLESEPVLEPEPVSEPFQVGEPEPAIETALAQETALPPELAVWATELEDARPQGEPEPDGPAQRDEPALGAETLIVGAPAWLLEPAAEPAPSVAFEAPVDALTAHGHGGAFDAGSPAPSDPFRIDQLRAEVDRVDNADLDRVGLGGVFGSAYAEQASAVVAEAEAAMHAAPAPAGDLLAPDDHDGLTILSSDLVAIRDQLPSWAGDEVPGPFRVVAPEPPAAMRLMLSTGAVVPLDRSVLLGRAPQVLRVTNSELPRLVSVPSPQQDISRTHAEVRMEGEDVLVTDLQSTNGVLVSRQGERARRLHPGEPTLVRPGELVDLGDGVTFTVERGT
ncbi:FHA domain-containing protein [Cellulomonas cellasea]|uniref:FHA domain-containing protein n=1 Tax=Cellulomonas cellasea TaxID=43670 RepID=UPI0025A4AA9C|nr:FHA domain-containing protein [Cellulomonas cellasea]MDM8084130.1 FHA domain-containing protein [Cellulomonas cellasea]